MELLRKILFYLFLAAYLILCPLIIFYALGYIFTPKSEEGFAKTGLIRLETLPTAASVSIANRRFTEKTPATIRNLLPGQYDVKISLKGYRVWERKVTVEPGKAATFEKILLVPQQLKTRTLMAHSFKDLWPVPETRFLLLKSSEYARDLKVFDQKNEVVQAVLQDLPSYAGAKVVRIFMAKESSLILIQIQTSDGIKFLASQLDKDKPEVKDLSNFFQRGEPDEITWEGNRPDYLFIRYGQELVRLDPEKMILHSKFLEKIRGFGLFRGKVYALRGSSIIRLNFNAKTGEEALVEKGVFLENLFPGEEKYKIDFITNHTICFLGERGELFSNVLPYRFVDAGVKGYQADAEGRKVVLWQEGRLGVLDFEKSERKKEFFERGPEIEWVFEKGESIRQAFFVYDAAYVLFCDKTGVFLARLGESPGIFSEKLIAVRDNSKVSYTEKTGKLYYLDPSSGYLMVGDILPEGVTFSGVIGELEKETQGAAR